MIVTMKKLALLLHHSDREELLRQLQELGLVHIDEVGEKDGSVLIGRQNALKEAQSVLAALPAPSDQELKALPAPEKAVDCQALVREYTNYKNELAQLDNRLADIAKTLEQYAPWGDFSPATLDKLAAAGLKLNFYVIKQELLAAYQQEDRWLEIINRQNGLVYVVSDANPADLPLAEHVHLPAKSPDGLKEELADLTRQRESLAAKMAAYNCEAANIARYVATLGDELGYESAKLNLGNCLDGKVLELEGYFPAANETEVKAVLDRQAVWYDISAVGDQDDAPIKFKNSRLNKLFLPITEIYQLPDYHEVETTPFIAPFFTLFFGVCLGDVGYGLLVLLIGLLGLWKGPKNMRSIMGLVNVLGLSTIACGFLLNGFFGQPIFGPGALFFPDMAVPLLSSYDEGWMNVGTVNGRTTYPAMSFALLVGFVQLCLGMLINIVNAWRQDGPVYALRPLSSLLMFAGLIFWWAAVPDFMNMSDLNPSKFSLGQYNIGAILTMVPDWLGMALTCAGVFLLLFFGSPDKKFFVRPALGLYDLYSFVTGIMGDLLSYIRLFALGLGGGLVGASFNSLAMMLITDKAGTVDWATPLAIFTVLIIVVGHAINFALSLVSSFVHPLRLTFVEFYKNLGFKGGGRPYQPLSMNPLNKKSN